MLTFIELLIGVVVIVGVARYIIKGYSATGVLFVGGLTLLIVSALMGHKVLLPVDVVLKIVNFCLSLGDNTAAFLLNSSGKRSRPGAAKNSFSIYHANTVGLTVSGAQFKRL